VGAWLKVGDLSQAQRRESEPGTKTYDLPMLPSPTNIRKMNKKQEKCYLCRIQEKCK
jgi:hypothetical protein